MKVVITGGGTGGHLYPGIALAETFMKIQPETQILFIGTSHGIGSSPIPQKGFLYETVTATGFVGKGLFSRMKSILSIPVGLTQSLQILKRFGPQLVIGIGGYVAVPVMLAASLLKIKRVILEPNVLPGLVNKIVAPICHLVVTTFEASHPGLHSKRIKRLGIPIRPEITTAVQPEKKEGHQTLLILGGSQGAHAINRAMTNVLPFLSHQRTRLTIIHQTGKNDHETVSSAYENAGFHAEVHPFIEDMGVAYARADLIISRAGAGTLSELGVTGKPSILIPFPFAGGHQIENAKAFVTAGASLMILEKELSGESFSKTITNLLSDSEKLHQMSTAARRQGNPNAAEDIVNASLGLVTKGAV